MIYLDNAATSWPKPPAVGEAMVRALAESGNPGRGGHRLAMRAADLVYAARETVAAFFHAPDPLSIVFAKSATEAINLAVKGLLAPGDHAVCSSMEHNAVWRPLKRFEIAGGMLSQASADADGIVAPDAVAACLRPETKLIALTHASNVNGARNDIAAVGALARARGIPFLVDAAQTAGHIAIDVEAMQIDLLAFPGHKGLQGPQGIGGLYLRPGRLPAPLIDGGTGSESESPFVPDYAPDRFEAGTLNLPGIAGLKAGIDDLCAQDFAASVRREAVLTRRLYDGLARIDGVRLYGPPGDGARVGVLSLTLAGWDAETAAETLDRTFDVAARAGLHCAPLAHRSLGTPTGTVRFSIGHATTATDIDGAVAAVAALMRQTP